MKSIGCFVSLLTAITLAGAFSFLAPLAVAGARPPGALGLQEENPINPEFSMQNVEILKLRGGNYWRGYFNYSVDFQKGLIQASWASNDRVMKKAGGRKAIDSKQLLAIANAVEQLTYQVLLPGEEECYVMADGDESSLTLQRSDHLGDQSLYPLKSWASQCSGQPLTNDSFTRLEDIIFKILPQPAASLPSR